MQAWTENDHQQQRQSLRVICFRGTIFTSLMTYGLLGEAIRGRDRSLPAQAWMTELSLSSVEVHVVVVKDGCV